MKTYVNDFGDLAVVKKLQKRRLPYKIAVPYPYADATTRPHTEEDYFRTADGCIDCKGLCMFRLRRISSLEATLRGL